MKATPVLVFLLGFWLVVQGAPGNHDFDPYAIGAFCSDPIQSCPVLAPPNCPPGVGLTYSVIKSQVASCLCILAGCDTGTDTYCNKCFPVPLRACPTGAPYAGDYLYNPYKDSSCVCTYRTCGSYW